MRTANLCVVVLLSLFFAVPAFASALLYSSSSFLPLTEVHTEIEITDQVCTTFIDHTFNNDNVGFVDATYCLPLPPGASIVGLGMWIDDELHYFALEPGQQGGGGVGGLPAFLQSYLGENPFAQSFADLEPGEITLRIEYTELLTYEFGDYTFEYPLALPSFASTPLDTFAVEVSGTSQRLIEDVQVASYQAQFQFLGDYEFSYSVTGSGVTTENLYSQVTVSQDDVGLWLMSHHKEDSLDPGHYLAIMEPGDIGQGDVLNKSFTFVIDRSGSMGSGGAMEEAKEAAIYCVTHLNDGDYFNIIVFSDFVEPWQVNPVLATPANIAAAVQHINSLVASGWTLFNDAVLYALNQDLDPTHANQVLVLSDGEPTTGVTDLPTIIQNIGNANTICASIFTVAAGDDADLDFLDYIAFTNSGLTLKVENLAHLAEEIEVFFQRFSSPVLTQVTLDMGDVNVEEDYPPAPYTIFAGSQTLVSGTYQQHGETMIELSATVAGRDTSLTYGPFTFTGNDTTSFSFVPRMWAIQKIDYWLAYMAVYGEDQDIIDMIVDLSLQYGILTQYTGYNTPVDERAKIAARATRDRSGVHLSWSLRPATDVSYDIYRREMNGRAYLKLNREPVRRTHFTDRSAERNVGYVYQIRIADGDVAVAPAEVRVPAGSSDLVVGLTASPNPFNAGTRISFSLSREMEVKLVVYDLLGREVAVLIRGVLQAGAQHAAFDASRLASGNYFLQLTATDQSSGETVTQASRLLLAK